MASTVESLVVSSRLEIKRSLLQILDGLPLNVYTASGVGQTKEVLKKHRFDVVLCDDHILDGTYHEVLALTVNMVPKPQFILLLTLGVPDEQLEAARLGAAEVVRTPFEATDIELALIHAMRGNAAVAHAAA